MKRILVSLVLLLGGLVIFVFGNPYYTVFPTNGNQVYLVVLVLLFLGASIALKRSQSLSQYWPAAYSLCVASAAMLFLNTGVLNLQRDTMWEVQHLAVDKLSQALHVVPVTIGMTLLAGDDLKAIFVTRGRWKRGLAFGLISFFLFGLAALLTQPNLGELLSALPAALPWILLWVLANGMMEELWFRAVFLKKYEVLVGRVAAILITALVFGLSHVNATYEFPGGGYVFGLVVFALGAIGAYSMFKDDSWIGPVLFHAGYDLMVVMSVLSSG
jgi:membrane protease YdiL (CAAX protease family)